MVYGFLGVGLLLFVIGSEALLRGGIALFHEVRIPTLFIGVLLVPLAMSANSPIMTSMFASTVLRL